MTKTIASTLHLRVTAISFILIGMIFFAVNWALSPEMNPLKNFTSDYVHTAKGALTIAGFLICGTGIVIASGFIILKSGWFEFGLGLYGALFLILGFFPADKEGFSTIIGILHQVIAFSCFLLFPAIITTQSVLLKRLPPIDIVILIPATLAGFILMGLNPGHIAGLYQRIFIFSQPLLVIIRLCRGRLLGTGL